MLDKHILEVTIQMLEDEMKDPSFDCRIMQSRLRRAAELLIMLKRTT
jgi:riboflavin synthase